ncbi:hypothetical protein D3C78_1623880 [compost metagenome]
MPGRYIIDQHAAELLQRLAVLTQRLRLCAKSVIGPDQFVSFLQPAIDQQVHSTPAFLSILTTFEHGDLSSLVGQLLYARTPLVTSVGGQAERHRAT